MIAFEELIKECQKMGIRTYKVRKKSVDRKYHAKDLIEGLKAILDEFGVDDCNLDVEYDEYDNPRSFSGFELSVKVDKTEEELGVELESRKDWEKKRREEEYQNYLRLKEKFED